MIRLKTLIKEAKINTKSWKTGWDIISAFDDIPQFKKYKIKGASYDDVYYEIPTDVFTKITGLNKKDVDKLSSKLEPYEGDIDWEDTNINKHKEHTVTVSGGA